MRRLAVIPTFAALLLLGAGCAAAPSSAPESAPAAVTPSSNQGIVIMVDENGFSPATITVPAGTEVTFNNTGSSPHQPASAVHPTHQQLPGFDALRGLRPGESYSYTFTKVGTWKYHDHLNPSRTGSITVTE